MKKLFILLVVLCLSSMAFAAAPVGRLGLGMQGLSVTTNAITLPTLQYYFNSGMAGELGLCYGSREIAGASVTNYTLALALKMGMLQATDNLIPHWGIGLAYVSNPALAANTSTTLIVVTVGAEYFVAPNLSVEGNINPLSYGSTTGGGVTINTLSVLNSAVGTPAATLGVHMYI